MRKIKMSICCRAVRSDQHVELLIGTMMLMLKLLETERYVSLKWKKKKKDN